VSKEDDIGGRDRVRRRRDAAALLLGLLVTSLLAAGCGNVTPEDVPSSPRARSPNPAVRTAGETGPPKAPGGVCERVAVDDKSLPSLARLTVERFFVAVDRGDRDEVRALLDPAIADDVVADLRAVTRLGLLRLEDRY
jgi:hypothetical protein